jgi:hypothetical protein
MIRQGRLDPRLSQGRLLRAGLRKLRGASRFWCCARIISVAILLFGSVASGIAQEPTEGPHAMRVRISWGGGSEQAWQVTARLEGGQLRDPQLLALTPETPGSAELSGNELRIIQPLAGTYGGVDVTLDGPADARLVLELHPTGAPTKRVERTIALKELKAGTVNAALDEELNPCSVARIAGDWLRVNSDRAHLVFEPGESWNLKLIPHLYPNESRSVRCTAKLVAARTNTPVLQTEAWDWELNEYGSGEPVAWDWRVPENEGVYDLIFEVEPQRYQQISFSGAAASGRLVRRVQFVVLGSKPPQPIEDAAWRVVSDLEASASARKDWKLGFGTRPAGVGFIAAGNAEATVTREVEGRIFLELGPGQWQTLSLPVKTPGKPHRLEIEYHNRDEMTLGFSLLEPDASGRYQVFGTDSGLVKRKEQVAAGDLGRVEKQVIEFWPSTAQTLLLIHNRNETAAAAIGKVRLLAGPERLGVAKPLQNSEATTAGVSSRGRMAFYEFPLFPENFGAEFAIDPGSGQLLTDWLTFYQGADRLVQHLNSHGYRGAMIAVVADGSALYPSQLLEATPRFDSGIFFSSGQDLRRKDVVELLMRMFSRAELELVPVLTLNGRLPNLERSIREGQEESVLLLDPSGRAPLNQQELARYNPLSRLVQQEVHRIVAEFVDRYDQHSAFKGVALTCQAETCMLLPGRRWGLELELVNQFLASQQQAVLSSVADLYTEQTQQYLFGTAREAWLAFRATSLTTWYEELQGLISGRVSKGKLYLAGIDIYRMGDLPSLLSPSLQWSIDLPGALRDLGWDLGQLERLQNTVLMRPNRVAPAASLVSERIEINLSSLEQTRQTLSRGAYSAGLFINRAAWSRISPLAKAGEEKESGELPLVRWQPLTLVGNSEQQRFAESLAHYDTQLFADGGWLLPTTGQSDDFFRTLGHLPDVKFELVTPQSGKSTITARQRSSGGQWHAYLVNSSPWPIKVELVLSGPPAAPLRIFPETLLTQRRDESTQTLVSLELAPFGLAVLESTEELVRIADYRESIAESQGEALRARLRRVQERLVAAAAPRAWGALKNSDCNALPESELGWRYDQQQTGVKLEPEPGKPANSALHLQSSGQTVWVRSNELPVSETGRLSISAWIRIDPEQPQPPLRISIEADSKLAEYYRFARVGSLARDDESAEKIAGEWKQFVVHFDDLPIHTAERCRIGFDLMAAGDVWIDRVEVFDRWFDQNDTKALTQLVAAAGPLLRDQSSWDDCRTLLDSYWLKFLDEFGSNDSMSSKEESSKAEPSEAASEASLDEEASNSPFGFRRGRRADKPRMFPFK